MSNPKSRGQQRDKPYRDALRMAATELDQIAPGAEPVCRYPKGSLRWIAWHQLLRAGDDTSAAKEVADRLDGKPAQSHEHSGADGGPIELESTDTRAMARAVMALFREANLDSPP